MSEYQKKNQTRGKYPQVMQIRSYHSWALKITTFKKMGGEDKEKRWGENGEFYHKNAIYKKSIKQLFYN